MKIEDIHAVTKSVTNKWTKQRKKEERESRSRVYRSEYVRMYRMPLTEAADEVIPEAYAKASNNGTLPAHARQIFYAARPKMQELTGKPLQSAYFTQTLLPKFMSENGYEGVWRVVYDARGHLLEPHTEETVPLGTLEVDAYLNDARCHVAEDPADTSLGTGFPTKGPRNRYGAILFIEKEGFNPLFEAVKLAERYDLAIMSTKGQSVTACRKLVDHLCHVGADVPVLILHDFDAYGLSIQHTLVSVSDAAWLSERVRYQFKHTINFIDFGLRLEDVEAWGLASETVSCKTLPRDLPASDAEREFLLSGQRVELNAFTSADFISWIESKLNQHRIKKVLPDQKVLVEVYRRAYQIAEINCRMEGAMEEARQIAEEAKIPRGLRNQIKEKLVQDPAMPWDKALAKIAEERLEDSAS